MNKYNIPINPLEPGNFYNRLPFYAVAKYTLVGLIFNEFNIKYLLNKYKYKFKFMKKLRRSCFYKFEEFFTLQQFRNFDRYFVCNANIKCQIEKN